DEQPRHAPLTPVSDLPDDTLLFLIASRYCDVDNISEFAWSKFAGLESGYATVQAIVDFAHQHIKFSYPNARPTRTASDALRERIGVCRDYAHLAITLCRAMNIPARYATGYLGDIGVPADPAPMDFSAWFEVFLDGRWYTFDARHNQPRIGRILMARGRDAADVALTTSFGVANLKRFEVTTLEVAPQSH
ncbi:MAG: transglutaminase-like domain-containing protein, partial [Beijerinckiaceae bacterium]